MPNCPNMGTLTRYWYIDKKHIEKKNPKNLGDILQATAVLIIPSYTYFDLVANYGFLIWSTVK